MTVAGEREFDSLSKEQLVERLKALLNDPRLRAPFPEAERLIHELEIHQVELEMQNRELRESQERLSQSMARYADLYDFAPLSYVTLDAEGRILEANLAAATLLGVERGRLIGRRLSSLVSAEWRQPLRHHVKRCFAETTGDAMELTAGSGALEPVVVQLVSAPVVDATGQVVACRAALMDISALKRSENMLRLLTQVSGTLASSLRDVDTMAEVAALLVPALADLCLVDVAERGALRRVAACGIKGTPSGAGVVRKLAGTVEAKVVQTCKPVLLSDSGDRKREGVQLSGALQRASSLVCVPMLSRGRAMGALTLAILAPRRGYQASDLAFAQDIASRMAVAIENAALYHDAERAVQAREDVLAVVSHDLRTPASAILLAAKALEDTGVVADPMAGRLVESIRRGVERMSRMIDDLLDASSIDSGHLGLDLREASTEDLVADAVASLAPMAREAHLELELDPVSTARVRCDRERVHQVLANLVGNAIKFAPRGSSIRIGAQALDGEVRFHVRDSGPGIDRTVLPHLFERYRQGPSAAARGRGLGLFICKGIVEAHGGTIRAESPPGKGTTISFTLPRVPEPRPLRPAREQRHPSPS